MQKLSLTVLHDMTLGVSTSAAHVIFTSLERFGRGFQEPPAIDVSVELGTGLVMAMTGHCLCSLRATQA